MANGERHIVAVGGAGLSQEDGLHLERYALGLAGVARPRVCYIGTASADREEGRERFYDAMRALDAEASHLALLAEPVHGGSRERAARSGRDLRRRRQLEKHARPLAGVGD